MDIVERLRGYDENDLVYKTDMIEAADRIEKLEAALQSINSRLKDEDSWLAQSINCRNIAEAALKDKKDD